MSGKKQTQKLIDFLSEKTSAVFEKGRLFRRGEKLFKRINQEREAIGRVRAKLAELYGPLTSDQEKKIREPVSGREGGIEKDGQEKRKIVKAGKVNEKKAVLVPISEIAKNSAYSKNYINFAARQGKLQAKKMGGVWHTTEEWLAEFTEKSKDKKEQFRKKLSKELGGKKKAETESLVARGPKRKEKEIEGKRFFAAMRNELGARRKMMRPAIALGVLALLFFTLTG